MASLAAIELAELAAESVAAEAALDSAAVETALIDGGAATGTEQLSAGGMTPLESNVYGQLGARAGLVAGGAYAASFNPYGKRTRSAPNSPLVPLSPPRKRKGESNSAYANRLANLSLFPPGVGHNSNMSHNMDVDHQPTGGHQGGVTGLQTNSDPSKRKKVRHVSMQGGKNAGLNNDIYRNRQVFGESLIQQQQSRCMALCMKVGKHEKSKRVESMDAMLHNMSQSGSVTTQWGGLITSEVGKRTSFMTVLRHNMSYNQNNAISYNATGSDGWPVDNVLMPTAAQITDGPGNSTINSSFHAHADESVWWTPLNRPDFEDMSWNLNRFKLTATTKNTSFYDGPEVTGQIAGQGQQDEVLNTPSAALKYIDFSPGGGLPTQAGVIGSQLAAYLSCIPPTLCSDVAPYRSSYHRRQSSLRLNNQRSAGEWTYQTSIPVVDFDPASPKFNKFKYTRGDTYKYNMVFNSGSLLYNFMNKDPNAAEVAVVVLKVKKSAGINGKSGDMANNELFLRNAVPIGEGYYNSVIERYGTDNLGGRPPETDDVWKLPNYPYLPHLKKTKQMNLPFTEVMRNTFVLPAGGRRAVKIDLPGQVYDPANIPLCNPENKGNSVVYPDLLASGTQQAQGMENIGPNYSDSHENCPDSEYVSIVDEYTYCVLIAVNGVQSTRNYTEPLADGNLDTYKEFILGDTYAAANIQYNCAYTENIGACEYKKKGKTRLFNNGLALIPNFETQGTATEGTTCILPVGQSTRVATSYVKTVSNAAGTLSGALTNEGAGVN